MSAVDPDDPRLKTRPIWGLLILALPVVGVALTALAYVGMVSLGLKGRAAEGRPMTLRMEGCAEAGDVVRARLDDMGYAPTLTPTPAGFEVTFTGPAEPDLREGLPGTLTAPGLLEVRAGERVLVTPEDVVDASVRLDVMMTASTLIVLGPPASDRVAAWVRERPDGVLDFFVDGARVGGQRSDAVSRGEVEIAPPIDDDAGRLRATARWAVMVDHPLPCPVQLADR